MTWLVCWLLTWFILTGFIAVRPSKQVLFVALIGLFLSFLFTALTLILIIVFQPMFHLIEHAELFLDPNIVKVVLVEPNTSLKTLRVHLM